MMHLDTDRWYQVAGVAMFTYLFAVIKFDYQFAYYFSCFCYALIALGLVLKLKNEFLNMLTISYLIVCIYLLVRQALWIGEHGLDADYAWLDTSQPGPPFWIHIIMHGLPIPVVVLVMIKTRVQVNWKTFVVIVLMLVAWSYTMDAERFLGLEDFFIAYPLGIPLTVVYLLVYQKYLRPRLLAKATKG